MKLNSRAWLLIALLIAAAAAGVVWYRSRTLSTPALMRRLPATGAMLLYVDFDALRRAGVLNFFDGSKNGQDPEYAAFVRSAGFNYTRDLDTALVAFAPTGKFLLLRGRFDWKRLESYVRAQSGRCADSFCRMAGSTPDRRISFFPLRNNIMGMAVSPDDLAAERLHTEDAAAPAPPVPDAPVWLSIPASVLRSGENLPEGTRMFARGMERAEAVTLGLAPEGNRLAARLNVVCANERDAAGVASQLTRITALLKEMIQREHQTPNPADFSGVLTSGSFRAEGRRVAGYWPIERRFLENMLGGA